eukprot:6418033-Prymnesium_polylepis.1
MGTAHNAAAELRSCLADKDARVRFTAETAAGNCDPEDVKLVLALKCQRARNLGYDPTGEWEVRSACCSAASASGELTARACAGRRSWKKWRGAASRVTKGRPGWPKHLARDSTCLWKGSVGQRIWSVRLRRRL